MYLFIFTRNSSICQLFFFICFTSHKISIFFILVFVLFLIFLHLLLILLRLSHFIWPSLSFFLLSLFYFFRFLHSSWSRFACSSFDISWAEYLRFLFLGHSRFSSFTQVLYRPDIHFLPVFETLKWFALMRQQPCAPVSDVNETTNAATRNSFDSHRLTRHESRLSFRLLRHIMWHG